MTFIKVLKLFSRPQFLLPQAVIMHFIVPFNLFSYTRIQRNWSAVPCKPVQSNREMLDFQHSMKSNVFFAGWGRIICRGVKIYTVLQYIAIKYN